jgi:hypothetical protein
MRLLNSTNLSVLTRNSPWLIESEQPLTKCLVITSALSDYDQSIKLDPKSMEAYINRAIVYANIGSMRRRGKILKQL